jgi:arsenate reductase
MPSASLAHRLRKKDPTFKLRSLSDGFGGKVRSAGYDRRVRRRILFLCTGNAARSQLAEALARLDWPEALDPVSAGSRPTGWVHPLAVRAMEALGANMSEAFSKSADEFREQDFDIVVTVCDSAAMDCPSWPGALRIEHWSIEDPSFGPDDPATRYERFLETRDDLRRRIAELVEEVSP